MTAKLGDTTISTNRSKYPSFDNTSHVNKHKQNKPWSAVLHDIFVSLADDSTFLEHQNDVKIIIIFLFWLLNKILKLLIDVFELLIF